MDRLSVPVSTIAALSQNQFDHVLDEAPYAADQFVEIEDALDQSLDIWKSDKRQAETNIKDNKDLKEQARSKMAVYLATRGLDKLKGKAVKSISYRPATETKETKYKEQIKVKGRYKDADDFSREELLAMLEGFGVTRRKQPYEVVVTKPAGIRVIR